MLRVKVKTRFGTGLIRQCRSCGHFFGKFTDRSGLGGMFILEDFELNLAMHEVDCLLGKWKELKHNPLVGTYEKKA